MHLILLLTLLVFSQDVVVHVFYTPDCEHCMDILLDDIPKLQNKYQFTLKKYDIDILKNYTLLEEMEKGVKDKGEDLPIIFVGDSVFYGPKEVRESLETTLKKFAKSKKAVAEDTVITVTKPKKDEMGEINLYYFYQPGCKECNRIEILLNSLQKTYDNFKVHRFNVFDDSSKIFLEGLASRNEIPEKKRLIVPAVIMGDDFLVKENITLVQINSLLKKYEQGSPKLDTLNFESAEPGILKRFSQFSIYGILLAGLLDGVNPCAFATLIFFVTYLLFIGRRRKDVIIMAFFFILAVFIAYFAIGIGAYNLLKYLSEFDFIAKIIFLGFGIIAITLGILSLRDYFIAKRGQPGKMILQLPLSIKQRIHKDIKEKTAAGGIIFGSLIAGFLISFLEFGCTGQVYLPTITFMVSKAGFSLKPLFALFVYNIMFILPLIVIAFVATILTTKKIAKSMETKIPAIKLLTAILFFALGILLILLA